MESNFNEIKQEILRRAKEASACRREYGRAYAAETISKLSQVIKDNFDWVCDYGVLTVDLIEQYKEDFSANDIYTNQNVENGYLLCSDAKVEARGNTIVKAYGNSKVEAYGNAKVEAYGNAKVEAFDSTIVRAYNSTMIQACNNATVKAFDDATVEACNNATVMAHGSSTVMAHGSATVEASGNATVRAYGNATVKAYDDATVVAYGNATVKAYDSATVEACNNATVEAYDNAYCTSYFTIDCKLFGHAIYRVRNANTVYYADSNIKFAKQRQKLHRTKNGIHSLLSLERVKWAYESAKWEQISMI